MKTTRPQHSLKMRYLLHVNTIEMIERGRHGRLNHFSAIVFHCIAFIAFFFYQYIDGSKSRINNNCFHWFCRLFFKCFLCAPKILFLRFYFYFDLVYILWGFFSRVIQALLCGRYKHLHTTYVFALVVCGNSNCSIKCIQSRTLLSLSVCVCVCDVNGCGERACFVDFIHSPLRYRPMDKLNGIQIILCEILMTLFSPHTNSAWNATISSNGINIIG